MEEYKLTLGLGITGSFCTLGRYSGRQKHWCKRNKSYSGILQTCRNFGYQIYDSGSISKQNAGDYRRKGNSKYRAGRNHRSIRTFDVMAIAPCTGNTMAKLQQGIVDTTVLMAAKAHLRNEKPLVLAISTNDALSMNLRNIGLLMNMKHIYFVPFRQDDYQKKPHSLVADFSRLEETIAAAMKEKQLQPVVLSPMPVDYK